MSDLSLPESADLQTQVDALSASLEVARKELAIEAALERVRTVAMSMQKPDDMLDVCRVISDELEAMPIANMRDVQTAVINLEEDSYLNYEYFTQYKQSIALQLNLQHPRVAEFANAVLTGEDAFYSTSFSGAELDEWKAHRLRTQQLPDPLLDTADSLHYYFFSIGSGALGISSYGPLREEEVTLFKRFRNVFDLAYRRFLDIEQALAQAKEARIEAALERVRARSMAMHRSEELVEASTVFFHELNALGFDVIRTGVGTVDEANETVTIWSSQIIEKNEIKILGVVPVHAHPFFEGYYTAWKNKAPYFTYELVGEDLKQYYGQMTSLLSYPAHANVNPRESFNVFFFAEGTLNVITPRPMTESECQLAMRFAKVFGLIYRRFLDLKLAEAQAREAQIQTGLERVRSRTMAMQTCEELSETAAVFFKELIRLGISPNRLYIAIIDSDDPNEVWFYATNEEGGQDCSMYTADIRENAVFKKMHAAWLAKERSLVFELRGDALATYFDYLRNVLHMPLSAHIPTTRRVHNLAFFSQGFVGIASLEEQPQETSQLLERFADVFNLTYTRFSDLKVAEGLAEQAEIDLIRLKEEKARTENALAELKAAQAQLIQAEKMASLGELTAGIAHEIQNPLNFVNNFAEVNAELIDELREELATLRLRSGQEVNTQSAIDMAQTIKENESKIIFHGKRADGIVKGMLQHSRASNGVKEPTDINALVDEYLRLAYHGLRAKDKSFNAAIKTEYDAAIGLINVVPQDIGRVVLNIITNAFHAVNTPRPPEGGGLFQPSLLVTTKLIPPSGGKGVSVEISISDNGPGIPSNILDKIFQPFFTTKPTGQGTGLGLSISYDIIHAHGGEIVVKSGEGEGTTFVITLPLSS